ncbi:MAG: TMEM165/GDT1 family protein [Elainellaceae cyanobacterium]
MLTAFTAGLLLITVSELGDKTFFIAAILSMRHPRRLVFAGAVAALAVMTILSVLVGQAASFIPGRSIEYVEIGLFTVFGLKLLYDAYQMTHQTGCDECDEAEEAINRVEKQHSYHQTFLVILTETFGLTFLAEWGDRTQIATITLAAAQDPIGVTLGAILGHAICAAIAVTCGRLACGRISEKTLTTIGGLLFLIFAGVALRDVL